MTLPEEARAVASKLLDYCRAEDWAGHDPYDALNSPLFTALPLLDARPLRLLFTQALRRSPLDIRGLARVPRTQNPKALALALAALVRLSRAGVQDHGEVVSHLIERLIALRSPDVPAWCWGYSFPWQTRSVLVPRGAPNLVCTSFVGGALLDAYEERGDTRCLRMARSAAEWVLNDLAWTDGDGMDGFAYPLASSRERIHNANLLGAEFLSRVSRVTGEEKFLAPALNVARGTAARQREDGSWLYGEAPSQRWIDNFHTGYNLCALHGIGRAAGTTELDAGIRRGLDFYRAHFFRSDGAPRYFHDRTYPIDIHCVAQSLITLIALRALDGDNVRLAASVFRWAMDHMWDERGFFYYRVLRVGTIRTSYMRWSQAWMLLALARIVEAGPFEAPHVEVERSACPSYVLITPARDEARFIELTITSVVAQTVRPLRWIIVSDGSTDGTDDIVRRYAADHRFIELVRMPERRERHFAGKIQAFDAGHRRVRDLAYDVIGSLDADISFDEDYFAFLLGRLARDPALGLVGTPFQGRSAYDYRFVSIEHVSGACQLFRRACFEAIGGYVPVEAGGVDHIAVITARMKGWKTRTFTEKVCRHHRELGAAQRGVLGSRFRDGALDYLLGSHPLWEMCRTAYQMTRRPRVVGGLMVLAGYVASMVRGVERPVSRELVTFRRREQMGRLKTFLTRRRESG